jgi:hypothetical protein
VSKSNGASDQREPLTLNEVLILPGFGFYFEPGMHAAVDADFPGQAFKLASDQFHRANPKVVVLVKHLAGTVDTDYAVIQ